MTEFIRDRGLSYAEFQARFGLDFHVIRSEVKYKAPARFDDLIAVGVRGSYRGPRIFWELAIFRDRELLATGELEYAVVDDATRRVKKIGPEVAEFLEMNGRE